MTFSSIRLNRSGSRAKKDADGNGGREMAFGARFDARRLSSIVPGRLMALPPAVRWPPDYGFHSEIVFQQRRTAVLITLVPGERRLASGSNKLARGRKAVDNSPGDGGHPDISAQGCNLIDQIGRISKLRWLGLEKEAVRVQKEWHGDVPCGGILTVQCDTD
jgi:hypothetical protein